MATRKGKRLYLFAIDAIDDRYATVRLRVPYCPEVLDMSCADDVFRLYWMFTKNKHKMQYDTSTFRKLPKFENHVEKVVNELAFHRATHLFVTKSEYALQPWLREVVERAQAAGITVTRVDKRQKNPPGIEDSDGMLQCRAWRRMAAGITSLRLWESSDEDPLEHWDADVALGGDGAGNPKRAARRGEAWKKVGGKAVANEERLEKLTSEAFERITNGEPVCDVLPHMWEGTKRRLGADAVDDDAIARALCRSLSGGMRTKLIQAIDEGKVKRIMAKKGKS